MYSFLLVVEVVGVHDVCETIQCYYSTSNPFIFSVFFMPRANYFLLTLHICGLLLCNLKSCNNKNGIISYIVIR